MSQPGVDPGLARIEGDLASSEFESGVSAGLWRVASLRWPVLVVAITAGDGNKLGMRLVVDRYPGAAPAGQPWDLERDVPLPTSRWPTGGSAPQVFRLDWSVQNANAPYMACDRTGLATHSHWATDHPGRAWHPARTITFYLLEISHELRGATLWQVEAAA